MEYNVIRSKRKTLALVINAQGEVVVRAPLRCSDKIIASFVESHEAWISKNLIKVEQRRKNAAAFEIDEADAAEYIRRAKEYLPARTQYWSDITGLRPSYVKITSAGKRFGSCNGKNGICYSYRLMAYPERAVDYVIVHELAHIKELNHSKRFWAIVESVLPDYKERQRILKTR
jgi:predicted metal-dependent hydrolase